MNEVEVVGRKCETSIQVVNLQSVKLATALPAFHALDERAGYGDELRRRAGSWYKTGLLRTLVIISQLLDGEVERSKEMITYLEP